MNRWLLVKDILLTGTGLALIVTQLFTGHPSDVILVAGLALTVPSVAGHAGAILSGRPGHGGPPSSSSSQPGGPSPSISSPPAVTGGE